jgi:uridine kinase
MERLISISGTHCTGKTTLISDMKQTFPNFNYINSTTRQVKEIGFTINEDGDSKTQLAVATLDLRNIYQTKPGLNFSDRGLIDTYIYTKYLYERGNVDTASFKFIETIYKDLIHKYSYIIYLKPEFDMVGDSVRSTDIQFQRDIEKMFDVELTKIPLPVINLSGSAKERLVTMKEFIKLIYLK